VKLLCTPSNASKSLLKKVDIKLCCYGGEGAIRELAEKILFQKEYVQIYPKILG